MRELRQQLINALLAVMTVAALIAAIINFQQQAKYRLPIDGATWMDQQGQMHPVAAIVTPLSPAENAGIHPGDELVSIAGVNVTSSSQAMQILASLGPWRKADYRILHGGIEVPDHADVAVVGQGGAGPCGSQPGVDPAVDGADEHRGPGQLGRIEMEQLCHGVVQIGRAHV